MGNDKIGELGKGTQFSSTNQPENRGRKISIKNQLKELLGKEGEMKIPKKQVIRVNDDGSVVISMPKQQMLAMKLMQWALSGKGNDSTKAIQMIMEQMDGKPRQSIAFEDTEILPTEFVNAVKPKADE